MTKREGTTKAGWCLDQDHIHCMSSTCTCTCHMRGGE